MTDDVETFFLCFWPLCLFSGEMAIQILCPFLNWVIFLLLSCKSSLYIMDTQPLSEKWLATIFFPFRGLSFCFLNSVHSLTKPFTFEVQFTYVFALVSFLLRTLTHVYWASTEWVNVPLCKLLILPERHFPYCFRRRWAVMIFKLRVIEECL